MNANTIDLFEGQIQTEQRMEDTREFFNTNSGHLHKKLSKTIINKGTVVLLILTHNTFVSRNSKQTIGEDHRHRAENVHMTGSDRHVLLPLTALCRPKPP